MNKPKSKFNMTQKEMELIYEECDDAISHCPNGFYDLFSNRYDDVEKLHKGKLDPDHLMNHYKKCTNLFSYGYSEYLSEDVLELFDRYDEYLISLRRWKRYTNA